MDGRIQEPVQRYLKEAFGLIYIDSITEPGPARILSDSENREIIDAIIKKVRISVDRHQSSVIAVSSHHDCAANPLEEEIKKEQITKSAHNLKRIFPECDIIGLWIDDKWQVNVVITIFNTPVNEGPHLQRINEPLISPRKC
jgi:hypothetical protein